MSAGKRPATVGGARARGSAIGFFALLGVAAALSGCGISKPKVDSGSGGGSGGTSDGSGASDGSGGAPGSGGDGSGGDPDAGDGGAGGDDGGPVVLDGGDDAGSCASVVEQHPDEGAAHTANICDPVS